MKLVLTVPALVICVDITLSMHNSRKRTHDPKETPFEYFTRDHGITIPVMVHLDQALTRSLSKEYKSKTRDRAKYLLEHILRNVEILFRRPSLNQTIHFTLLDVKLLRNGTKKFAMDENVSKYLGSYCRWQGEKKMEKKKWYYSVLFTGLDVFSYEWKNNTKVWGSAGRSYLSSICRRSYSCALLEWQGDITMKLAHEIGHSLGMAHDGAPYNQCNAADYIMASKYGRDHFVETWSPCSQREFQKFLSSEFSWCVIPVPDSEI